MRERGTRQCTAQTCWLLGLLLVAVAVLVALAVAPAAAAPDPCSATGERPAVVATPPDESPAGPGDTVGVYRGSELVVHLCARATTRQRLDASDRQGIEVLHGTDDRVRIRIAAGRDDGTASGEQSPGNETLAITSLGELAEPTDVPGPNVTLVDHAVATALLDRPLPVDSSDRADELHAADRTFQQRDAALEARLEELDAATADAASGAPSAAEPLNATLAAHERYREAADRLRAVLYAVATSDLSSARTSQAIATLAEREDARAATAREQVGAYDGALVEYERSLTWSLRLRVLGLGLVGLLVGGAAGAALPIYRGRAARRRLQRGEWTTYSRYNVVVPAAVGAVLLLLGLGWLALTVGWNVLEVVL